MIEVHCPDTYAESKNLQEFHNLKKTINFTIQKTAFLQILSELEIARREREIIENLERSEQMKQKLHQEQEQQQQQMWESQHEELGAGETDDHLQYQEVSDIRAVAHQFSW